MKAEPITIVIPWLVDRDDDSGEQDEIMLRVRASVHLADPCDDQDGDWAEVYEAVTDFAGRHVSLSRHDRRQLEWVIIDRATRAARDLYISAG